MNKKIVERAYDYSRLMVDNTQYQKGFSHGAFHGYQNGVCDQKEIDIENTIDWLKNNWRKFIRKDKDDMIGFPGLINDLVNYLKNIN